MGGVFCNFGHIKRFVDWLIEFGSFSQRLLYIYIYNSFLILIMFVL